MEKQILINLLEKVASNTITPDALMITIDTLLTAKNVAASKISFDDPEVAKAFLNAMKKQPNLGRRFQKFFNESKKRLGWSDDAVSLVNSIAALSPEAVTALADIDFGKLKKIDFTKLTEEDKAFLNNNLLPKLATLKDADITNVATLSRTFGVPQSLTDLLNRTDADLLKQLAALPTESKNFLWSNVGQLNDASALSGLMERMSAVPQDQHQGLFSVAAGLFKGEIGDALKTLAINHQEVLPIFARVLPKVRDKDGNFSLAGLLGALHGAEPEDLQKVVAVMKEEAALFARIFKVREEGFREIMDQANPLINNDKIGGLLAKGIKFLAGILGIELGKLSQTLNMISGVVDIDSMLGDQWWYKLLRGYKAEKPEATIDAQALTKGELTIHRKNGDNTLTETLSEATIVGEKIQPKDGNSQMLVTVSAGNGELIRVSLAGLDPETVKKIAETDAYFDLQPKGEGKITPLRDMGGDVKTVAYYLETYGVEASGESGLGGTLGTVLSFFKKGKSSAPEHG